MIEFTDLSDDFYVNVNLNTEMEIASTREGVMHYFEQVQRQYPGMTNFYARERGEFVLEEEKEKGFYRWTSVEPRRVCSGYVNPADYHDAIQQHYSILEQLPYTLSISGLDCESLNFMFGFDFSYRGNQTELIAEALGVSPALEPLLNSRARKLIGVDPSIQFALDDDCRLQCRISVESRTSTFAIKTGEFPEEQLSVYLTIRRYGSLLPGVTYVDAIKPLQSHAESIVSEYLVENVLVPLQRAIAIR
jgi:hypothetical protein